MNIFPKNIFKGYNSDGSKFTIVQWDYNTFAGLQAAHFLFTFVVSILIGAIAAPILFILTLFSSPAECKPVNLLGIIIGNYYLYDCAHGWLGLCILNLFCEESTINILVAINIAAIILHIAFLLFGVTIYNHIINQYESVNKRWLYLIAIIAFVTLFCLLKTTNSLKKHIGWVAYNIEDPVGKEKERLEEEKRLEKGSFNSKEERDAYFDEMQRRYGD